MNAKRWIIAVLAAVVIVAGGIYWYIYSAIPQQLAESVDELAQKIYSGEAVRYESVERATDADVTVYTGVTVGYGEAEDAVTIGKVEIDASEDGVRKMRMVDLKLEYSALYVPKLQGSIDVVEVSNLQYADVRNVWEAVKTQSANELMSAVASFDLGGLDVENLQLAAVVDYEAEGGVDESSISLASLTLGSVDDGVFADIKLDKVNTAGVSIPGRGFRRGKKDGRNNSSVERYLVQLIAAVGHIESVQIVSLDLPEVMKYAQRHQRGRLSPYLALLAGVSSMDIQDISLTSDQGELKLGTTALRMDGSVIDHFEFTDIFASQEEAGGLAVAHGRISGLDVEYLTERGIARDAPALLGLTEVVIDDAVITPSGASDDQTVQLTSFTLSAQTADQKTPSSVKFALNGIVPVVPIQGAGRWAAERFFGEERLLIDSSGSVDHSVESGEFGADFYFTAQNQGTLVVTVALGDVDQQAAAELFAPSTEYDDLPDNLREVSFKTWQMQYEDSGLAARIKEQTDVLGDWLGRIKQQVSRQLEQRPELATEINAALDGFAAGTNEFVVEIVAPNSVQLDELERLYEGVIPDGVTVTVLGS